MASHPETTPAESDNENIVVATAVPEEGMAESSPPLQVPLHSGMGNEDTVPAVYFVSEDEADSEVLPETNPASITETTIHLPLSETTIQPPVAKDASITETTIQPPKDTSITETKIQAGGKAQPAEEEAEDSTVAPSDEETEPLTMVPSNFGIDPNNPNDENVEELDPESSSLVAAAFDKYEVGAFSHYEVLEDSSEKAFHSENPFDADGSLDGVRIATLCVGIFVILLAVAQQVYRRRRWTYRLKHRNKHRNQWGHRMPSHSWNMRGDEENNLHGSSTIEEDVTYHLRSTLADALDPIICSASICSSRPPGPIGAAEKPAEEEHSTSSYDRNYEDDWLDDIAFDANDDKNKAPDAKNNDIALIPTMHNIDADFDVLEDDHSHSSDCYTDGSDNDSLGKVLNGGTEPKSSSTQDKALELFPDMDFDSSPSVSELFASTLPSRFPDPSTPLPENPPPATAENTMPAEAHNNTAFEQLEAQHRELQESLRDLAEVIEDQEAALTLVADQLKQKSTRRLHREHRILYEAIKSELSRLKTEHGAKMGTLQVVRKLLSDVLTQEKDGGGGGDPDIETSSQLSYVPPPMIVTVPSIEGLQSKHKELNQSLFVLNDRLVEQQRELDEASAFMARETASTTIADKRKHRFHKLRHQAIADEIARLETEKTQLLQELSNVQSDLRIQRQERRQRLFCDV